MSDYMGLTTINGSDFVSPDIINENFEKLDALGCDYVVDQGASGEWWYRKWNSGRAECGVVTKVFDAMEFESMSVEGLYVTSYLSFGAYPFAFTTRPFTAVSFEGDSYRAGRGCFLIQQETSSTTVSPSFRIVDWVTDTIQPRCGIYVCGSYK